MKQKRVKRARSVFVRNRSAAKLIQNERQEIIFNLRPSKNLIRNETLEGRKFTVVPMVMMTEGVHRGSNGSLYYPADELGKTPCVWNMKPIVVNHPEANGVGMSACDPEVAEKYKIGMIMNTEFDDLGRLKAEAWIEAHRADEIEPRIMEAVENQTMMELSTGVFVDKDYVAGEYEGEAYEAIARNYRPDHLAVLPDKKGACAIEDGAGFIRNRADEAPGLVDAILVYNAKKPSPSKDEPKGDPAQAASQQAVKKGAWAVIGGTKKAHEGAAQAHEKAARLYTKAKNKAFADWHNQKASDHKNWADEAPDASAKPTDNEFDDGNGGTDANANDDKGVPIKAEDSDAAIAQATERSNKAMTSGKARLHKNAAIAHRYAASAVRRANKGTDDVQSKYHMNAAKLHDAMAKNSKDITENELSFDDKRSQLSKQLREGNPECMCWVNDVFDDYFVYDDGSGKLFKQDYCVNDDDTLEFEGEPAAVVRKTSYEPAANEALRGTITKNNKNMNKKKLIEALIANHGWEESDRKYLLGLPEERLLVLHNQAEALATKNTQTAKDHANVSDPDEDSDAEDNQDDDRGEHDNGGTSAETIKKGAAGKATVGATKETMNQRKPKKVTLNEWMETAPPEVQEAVREAQVVVQNERTKLIESITANEANEYDENELKAMPMPQLRKLAKIAGIGSVENAFEQAQRRPNYSGQGDAAPIKNEDGSEDNEVLEVPVMNFERAS